jgi:hypothetical protein
MRIFVWRLVGSIVYTQPHVHEKIFIDSVFSRSLPFVSAAYLDFRFGFGRPGHNIGMRSASNDCSHQSAWRDRVG